MTIGGDIQPMPAHVVFGYYVLIFILQVTILSGACIKLWRGRKGGS